MQRYGLLWIILFAAGSAFAQDKSVWPTTYRAFLTNDLATWRTAISELQTAPASIDNYLAIGRAAYGAAGTGIALEDYDAVAGLLDTAEAFLEIVLEKDADHAQARALLAGCWGLRIALKPLRGMTLGSKCQRYLDRARAADPDDPMVHYQLGMNRYNTPAAFGGDLDQAIEHFQRARTLLETRCPDQNWLYLASHAWLGQALTAADRPDEARAVYAQALSIEPDFGWVRYLLSQVSK
jgi:tetratricopeptide (TPR) repeat protein